MADQLLASTGSHVLLVTGTSVLWPTDGTFPFTNATWTRSTRNINSTNAWTNYVFQAGGNDFVYIGAPTLGFQPGYYEVESRTNASNIVLKADPRLDNTSNTGATLTGWMLGNGVSGNRGSSTTTAAESILATAKATIIEQIILKTVDTTTARAITILAHDGTTTIHTYTIGVSAAALAQPPQIYFGPFGRYIKGGFSASSANASTTFEVFFRKVG